MTTATPPNTQPQLAFQAGGGKVVAEFPRADPALIERLRDVPTSILSDCLERFGVMDSAIKPLLPGKTFAGSALTVEEIEAGNLMSHLALKYVQPGDVLVVDAKGVTRRACWGGLQTYSAQLKGVAAIVIDGAIRDLDDVAKYGVPVYARAVTPAGPHKGWGGYVGGSIACGGVAVNPGDMIVGDSDGLVVVPRLRAAEIAGKTQQKLEIERQWFERVGAGTDTADLLGFDQVAAKLGVEIVE